MVGSEILRNADRGVRRITNSDGSGLRLRKDELPHIVPLRGNFAVERIVNEDGEIQFFCFHPSCHLLALFALRKLHVGFRNGWRHFFFANDSYSDCGSAGFCRRAGGLRNWNNAAIATASKTEGLSDFTFMVSLLLTFVNLICPKSLDAWKEEMRYTFLPAKSSLYVVKIEKVAGIWTW